MHQTIGEVVYSTADYTLRVATPAEVENLKVNYLVVNNTYKVPESGSDHLHQAYSNMFALQEALDTVRKKFVKPAKVIKHDFAH